MEKRELAELRNKLDEIDETIIRSLIARMDLSSEIGKAKAKSTLGGIYYDPAREAQVIQKLRELAGEKLPAHLIQRIYKEIMSESLNRQQPLTVSYLGPVGTFSYEAALNHFGVATNLAPVESITNCFESVKQGKSDMCIVPYENSTEGGVGETLQMLCSTNLVACGETRLRISQNLVGPTDMKLEDIKTVYSHPQAIAQSRSWLAANLPGRDLIDLSSTGVACVEAAKTKQAAIGPQGAALHHELEVLATSIEDNPNNITRFLVLGNHPAKPSGHDQTTLVISVAEKPGALYSLIKVFADANINMSQLVSRPNPDSKAGNYVFYIDVPGHQDESPLAEILPILEKESAILSNIGSYPISTIVD